MSSVLGAVAPDSLSYHVVYDISRRGPKYLWVLIVPFGLAAFNHVLSREDKSRRKRFHEIMTGFAILLGVIVAIGMLGQYLDLRVALARGNYQLVEGVVTDFVPADVGDHKSERFTVFIPRDQYVYQHRYEYSPSTMTQGFNQTQAHGGPIREGLRVRIADVHGKIARLEIAR